MINLIEEADVTLATLSVELERAVIQYETRDDSLYVNEDGYFPFWLYVKKSAGLVGFGTYIAFRDSTTELQRLNLANEFNKYAFGITAYVSGDRLKIDHIVNFRAGLLRETFVRVSRNFAATITNSIRDHDPNYEILLPLSETPAESSRLHQLRG